MSQLPEIPVVLVLNLDRHLTREQRRQWYRFYKELHDVRIVDFCQAYWPSQIRRCEGRYRITEHWKPIAIYALCPPGMKEEKRKLVPSALETWEVVFEFEDVCWQESRDD
jgi:hypothetical protein